MNKPSGSTGTALKHKASTIGELFSYLRQKGGWLLIPMVTLIVIIAILVILAQTSGVTPFLYPL
jgi:lipoprotein signal peptidase